ncbi:MAG: nucleoid occlusion factor SlmA [Gammaproteobacteria bacterium]|nr:nucleoid occlusion factor SlmA [Gammaproteobacteria bacterium]
MARRDEILQVLAKELESNPGERITTAALARAVGVSEAALYRHFPSKARMFEGLIEFAEQSVFGLFNRIIEENRGADRRCEHIVLVLLKFAERNPGIARLLCGDVLTGEHERLRARVSQFFERIETQLRQVIRETALEQTGAAPTASASAVANMLAAYATGRIEQFVRSEFRALPTAHWEEQWPLLSAASFRIQGLAATP